MICRIIFRENLGLQKRSSSFPLAKGYSAIRAQAAIPRQVASAAPQMPNPKTARNRNSSPALSTDIKIFRNILPLICPQIRR